MNTTCLLLGCRSFAFRCTAPSLSSRLSPANKHRIELSFEPCSQKGVPIVHEQKHTTGGIPRWSPTLVLVTRFSAYVWQSGRDAQFSLTYGRMCYLSTQIKYIPIQKRPLMLFRSNKASTNRTTPCASEKDSRSKRFTVGATIHEIDPHIHLD